MGLDDLIKLTVLKDAVKRNYNLTKTVKKKRNLREYFSDEAYTTEKINFYNQISPYVGTILLGSAVTYAKVEMSIPLTRRDFLA